MKASVRTRMGVSIRPELVPHVKDKVIEFWCSGLDTKDISLRTGMSEAWCYAVLSKWREEKIKSGTSSDLGI